jgi:hypothetical protein
VNYNYWEYCTASYRDPIFKRGARTSKENDRKFRKKNLEPQTEKGKGNSSLRTTPRRHMGERMHNAI